MEKIEHIQNYKGESILIYRIIKGKDKGDRFCQYGNYKYETIAEAKAVIDEIKA